MQPEINRRTEAMQDVWRNQFQIPILERLACYSVLGFCKMENRSPKRLARLKHSMTMTTVEGFRAIRFEL